MYMTRSVFYGCSIMELIVIQEVELRKIYEGPLLKKLELSEKFSRKLLYARWSAFGIRILQPNTIIVILMLRQYVGNIRIKNNTEKMIHTTEDLITVNDGYSKIPI